MLSVNTEYLVKEQNELMVTENLIDFVKSSDSHQMGEMIKQGLPGFLLALPYMITVDFLNLKIKVLFHREVFQSVGEL